MSVERNEDFIGRNGKKYEQSSMNKEIDSSYTENIDLEKDELIINEISSFLYNMHVFILKSKPHIKKYEKIRKLHGEIVDSMMEYNDAGKFKLKFLGDISKEELMNTPHVNVVNSYFDTSRRIGAQAIANILIYKNSKDMNCITEEYINKNKFRKPEKKEFLNSMLNSVAGLFEIINTDSNMGQVIFKDVFTKKEYIITDIGLSSNFNNERFYFYTRIITYDNISFGTGINIVFDKKDDFIRNWIKENKKIYNKKHEINRFLELYNEYEKDNKGIEPITRTY